MKTILDIKKVLKDKNFNKKIWIYMSRKVSDDDYDKYEKNYTFSNINPVIIEGYVRSVSPEALVYKQYGLHQMGAVEIICESKYKNYFENCNKIVIDSITYQVFKEGTGNRTLIQSRPGNLLRVILSRNG